ncbi:MAG: CoA-binding protein [Alphaproteobacteria bacterium]
MFTNPSDDDLRGILLATKTIALVGASANPARASYGVMKRLLEQGYVVHPINPGLAGQELLGQTTFARLADVPGPVDCVEIFRNSEVAGTVVDEALSEKQRLSLHTIWMQLGIANEDAANRAIEAGLRVVMDRCLKIEIERLGLVTGR